MNYEKVYSGVSTYGRVTTIYSSITSIMILIIFVIVGIIILNKQYTKENKYNKVTSATIKNIVSTSSTGKQQINTELEIEYIVGNNIYNRSIIVSENFSTTQYKPGKKIDIKYNENDPYDAISTTELPIWKYVAYILLAIGILGIISMCINIYLTKYKEYTAVEGTKSIIGGVSSSVNQLFR